MNILKHSALGIMAATVAAFGLNGTADAQFYKGKRVNIILITAPVVTPIFRVAW